MTRLFAGTPYDRPPTCDRCGKQESDCKCPPILIPKTAASPDKKTVRLSVEKRKKGKVVTVIRGLSARADDLPALLTQLKNQCGAGGTLDGETLELQGNHIERLRTLLGAAGYSVRG
jgi:translation initiation factor 1